MKKSDKEKLDYYMKQSLTVIHYKEEDGSYFVKVKELPGCMSVGDTLVEANEIAI